MDPESHPTRTTSQNARKRKKQLSQREKQKIERHSLKLPAQRRDCRHHRGNFRCNEVTDADSTSFAKGFYSVPSKNLQDTFLLKYCLPTKPKRQDRQFGGSAQKIRTNYLLRKESGEIVKICKKFFFNVIKISEFRVNRVVCNHFETGNIPKENRGGDRKSELFMRQKLSVISFIESFHLIDLHYCRSKIKHRQYLPSELNINKMAEMYNEQEVEDLRVKSSYFRVVFNTCFNIGFKSPATDLCSTCIMLTEQIKHSKKDNEKKRLKARKKIHILRAKAFFKLLHHDIPGTKTFSFDAQKNQLLPRVADQAAYRSRQLYQNNFGIVEGCSKSNLTKDNVFLYEWTENIRPKGANEIASALYHRLINSEYNHNSKIRLFADGCGGQNKNSIVVGMCAYWLQSKSSQRIRELELIFPVVGHSYMPPDRVFALIEKVVKKKQAIVDPDEYVAIFGRFGTVFKLGGNDCPVYDWKSMSSTFLKTPAQLHFKFNPCKRFVLKKSGSDNVVIKGENYYERDLGDFQQFCKRGFTVSDMEPQVLECGVPVAHAKLYDVNDLLSKHFGINWKQMNLKELKFYKDLIPDKTVEQQDTEEEDIEQNSETDDSSSEIDDNDWI